MHPQVPNTEEENVDLAASSHPNFHRLSRAGFHFRLDQLTAAIGRVMLFGLCEP
jgi:hypothetical protein